jgi:hypothetical protein
MRLETEKSVCSPTVHTLHFSHEQDRCSAVYIYQEIKKLIADYIPEILATFSWTIYKPKD